MNSISISRRKFAQLLSAGAACAVVKPALSLAKTASRVKHQPAPTLTRVVRLSSNENPYGPSPHALKAMTDAFNVACRYPDEAARLLSEKLATLNSVNANQILLGDGSGEILKLCAETFTGAQRGKLVAGDPTFEAILQHATVNGAEVVKVPLTDTFAHDLTKMGAVANAALVYICNPNNPTASITPKNELADFISKTSPQTMILVDEAYFHYADSPDYDSVIPLIKDHPNLIVARTFSKIYGMAGLRCGYAVGQPETIAQLRPHQSWDSVNIMAVAAATASLNDPDQVTNGRRLNLETRTFLTTQLDAMDYKYIPSQANFVMIDVKRPVLPLIKALKERNVEVGRLFPALPNHMRLTIGKKGEMEAFLLAFRRVLA
jgi:histidinol-phosphate aminotransferase